MKQREIQARAVDTGCDEIPDTHQCAFIESGACNTDGRIDYLHFYCCTMEHLHWLAIILFVRSSLDQLVRASRERERSSASAVS